MALLKTAQDIANEIAQKNAVELLGLPPNNTAMDRARALGFDVDSLLYHGSVKDFDAFDPGVGNIEGHLGQSIYLTDNPVDASMNYANKQSPDLVGKATINTWEEEPEQWIDKFADNEGVVYPVFARKGNQLDLTEEADDYIDFLSEFDDEGNLIKESENVNTVYNTLYDSQSRFDDINPEEVMADLQMYDELPARSFDDSLRTSKGLMYATDDLGDNASNEIARRVYDDLGYDSVKINANENFENLMSGFDNANHTMLMKPENVRSKFAAFDPKKLGIGAGSIVSTNLLASEADKQKALEDKIAKYGELKAPERNPVLGLIADVGKFTLPDWLNSAPSLIDDMSYGYSGIKNVSGYPTPDTRFIDMADFIPAAGAAGMIKNLTKGQKYTSAATSINKDKLPAVFTKLTKEAKFAPGSRNIDIGGGKFDNASEHLAKQDVENLVFDPYNRSADHNRMVLDSVRGKPADTATVSNVLNVIPDEANQIKTLETAYKSLKDDGEVFITVYEGNKSGVGKVTGADQFQQNKKLSDYLDTVRKVFPNATVKGGMIRAIK